MWSVVEERINKTAHNTVGDLKGAIVEGASFRPRFEQVIKTEGGFIE